MPPITRQFDAATTIGIFRTTAFFQATVPPIRAAHGSAPAVYPGLRHADRASALSVATDAIAATNARPAIFGSMTTWYRCRR
jgi:hypothetical protein